MYFPLSAPRIYSAHTPSVLSPPPTPRIYESDDGLPQTTNGTGSAASEDGEVTGKHSEMVSEKGKEPSEKEGEIDEEEILGVGVSRNGFVFGVVTRRELVIWQARVSPSP